MRPYALLGFLAAACFTLGTVLQPRASVWTNRRESGGLLQTMMGDSRRLFANHFMVKADISFHSGYYPSIFDTASRPKDRRHLTGNGEAPDNDHHEHTANCRHPAEAATASEPEHEHTKACDHSNEATQESQHEKEMAFLGKPRDWVEAFGRNFIVTEHKHLESGGEKEILPWLRVAADLNPDQPDTYIVAAYWLQRLHRTKEAESFLREGLRNRPDCPELYFELGRLQLQENKDAERAKNLWDLALKKWSEADKAGKQPEPFLLDQIAVNLSRLEESQGHLARAIELLNIAVTASPHPESLQAQIEDLRKKMTPSTVQ